MSGINDNEGVCEECRQTKSDCTCLVKCIRCGGEFDKTLLNGDDICENCEDEETP